MRAYTHVTKYICSKRSQHLNQSHYSANSGTNIFTIVCTLYLYNEKRAFWNKENVYRLIHEDTINAGQ